MDFEQLSLTLTTITAIAAILGPIISTIISIRSNRKLRKMEMYAPRIFQAVQKLSDAYSQFPRKADYEATSDIQRPGLVKKSASAHRALIAAAYELMSLIADDDIHAHVNVLIASLEGHKFATSEHDKKYQSLTSAIALNVSRNYSAK